MAGTVKHQMISTVDLALLFLVVLVVPLFAGDECDENRRSQIISNRNVEAISRDGEGSVELKICFPSCFDRINKKNAKCWCCFYSHPDDPPCFSNKNDCLTQCPPVSKKGS